MTIITINLPNFEIKLNVEINQQKKSEFIRLPDKNSGFPINKINGEYTCQIKSH